MKTADLKSLAMASCHSISYFLSKPNIYSSFTIFCSNRSSLSFHHVTHRRSCVKPQSRRLPLPRPFALPTIHVNTPLISSHDHWGIWTVLLSFAAFGIWSEKETKVGKALSGALVSTLVGLAATSVGIIASEASAYRVVMDFLLPLAVPLLLFNADLRKIVSSTGKLFLSFLLGSGEIDDRDSPLFLFLTLFCRSISFLFSFFLCKQLLQLLVLSLHIRWFL